jgi:hypothetical protein
MKHACKLATAALCLASLPALAADHPSIKPGEYSYSMKTEMPGMPFAMPPMTFSHCVTQEDVDKGDAYLNSKEKNDCKVENLKHGKGTASYDVVCTGKRPMTGHYDVTFGGDSMTSVGTMNMDGKTIKHAMDAKRVGDCKK